MLDEVIEFYKEGYCFDDELIKPIIVYDRYGNIDKSYEPYYEITTFGRIWSVRRGEAKWLTPRLGSHGYLFVTLHSKSFKKQFLIHRLVLFTFKGPSDFNEECRHLDGNKINCRLDNLEWGTHSDNMCDKLLHNTHNRGERQGLSMLTEEKIKKIREIYNKGGSTQKEVAKNFGVSQQNISDIINYKRWGHIN